mmetsp:Transcript_44830/g.138660  ORF Transcript_44830/g.138660 Transcript_44830/m.138660 type:complete len:214 (-) Transcript_44830:538-1179(-)
MPRLQAEACSGWVRSRAALQKSCGQGKLWRGEVRAACGVRATHASASNGGPAGFTAGLRAATPNAARGPCHSPSKHGLAIRRLPPALAHWASTTRPSGGTLTAASPVMASCIIMATKANMATRPFTIWASLRRDFRRGESLGCSRKPLRFMGSLSVLPLDWASRAAAPRPMRLRSTTAASAMGPKLPPLSHIGAWPLGVRRFGSPKVSAIWSW